MVNLNKYPIFAKCITTLKETSKDDEHGIFMTDSSCLVVNFDKVKYEYIKNLGLAKIPQSNDALLAEDENGNVVFVEFRNGAIKEHEIRKKIYDSVLIYTDITSSQISAMREFVKYILVYNESKITEERTKEEMKRFVQSSDNYDDIAKRASRFGDEVYVKFGVNIFKNYCFKEVYTYTKEEFATYLDRLKQSSS